MATSSRWLVNARRTLEAMPRETETIGKRRSWPWRSSSSIEPALASSGSYRVRTRSSKLVMTRLAKVSAAYGGTSATKSSPPMWPTNPSGPAASWAARRSTWANNEMTSSPRRNP